MLIFRELSWEFLRCHDGNQKCSKEIAIDFLEKKGFLWKCKNLFIECGVFISSGANKSIKRNEDKFYFITLNQNRAYSIEE